MNIDLSNKNLTKYEKHEIENLLSRENPKIQDDLVQMWYLMDLVWDDFGCDNKVLNWCKIEKFYSHPVWLLNGLFIEQHTLSMMHRYSIGNWIILNKFQNILDYGGGFGTLARFIADKNPQSNMNIYEPHPSEFGLKCVSEFNNIKIIHELTKEQDCLISTDVLEHVADPIHTLSTMVESVKVNGYLVIANAFFPMIKCHLPQNFHLRYSFNFFAKMMGLRVIGKLEDSHATIYIKTKNKEFTWQRIRFYEKISVMAFPAIEILKPILRPIKRLLLR